MAAGPNRKTWRWRANPRHYRCHELGDVTFVYNHLSGDTHMLNLVSIALLNLMAARSFTLDELAEAFPAHMGVPNEECPPGVVRRLFDELDEVGLVERSGGA